MKEPACGLSQQADRSWGQPDLGGARKGGSSPDNDGLVRYHQTHQVRQARWDGVKRIEPVVEPPLAAHRLKTWWIGAGQQRTHTA